MRGIRSMRACAAALATVLLLATTVAAQPDLDALRARQDLRARVDALESRVSSSQSSQQAMHRHVEEIRADIEREIGALRAQLEALEAASPIDGRNTPIGANDAAAPDAELDSEPWDGADPGGIEITGFADVVYDADESGGDIALGQVEVDLEKALFDDRIVIAEALAYDAESEVFGLGALTVDLHLFGDGASHVWSSSRVQQSGVIAGRFDVPFGIDWLVYPSIDRRLVSVPLVVENGHHCWNDYGVQLYLGNARLRSVVYGTRGFGYAREVEGEDEPIEIDMDVAVGGRLGLRPVGGFELGFSAAGFFDNRNRVDMSLLGVDFQSRRGGFAAKGELIARSVGLAGDASEIDRGFYLEGTRDIGNYFLVGRYGVWRPESGDDQSRFCVGTGWYLHLDVQMRFEYQANLKDVADRTFLQLVVEI